MRKVDRSSGGRSLKHGPVTCRLWRGRSGSSCLVGEAGTKETWCRGHLQPRGVHYRPVVVLSFSGNFFGRSCTAQSGRRHPRRSRRRVGASTRRPRSLRHRIITGAQRSAPVKIPEGQIWRCRTKRAKSESRRRNRAKFDRMLIHCFGVFPFMNCMLEKRRYIANRELTLYSCQCECRASLATRRHALYYVHSAVLL